VAQSLLASGHCPSGKINPSGVWGRSEVDGRVVLWLIKQGLPRYSHRIETLAQDVEAQTIVCVYTREPNSRRSRRNNYCNKNCVVSTNHAVFICMLAGQIIKFGPFFSRVASRGAAQKQERRFGYCTQHCDPTIGFHEKSNPHWAQPSAIRLLMLASPGQLSAKCSNRM
jgi:hypothetical protein